MKKVDGVQEEETFEMETMTTNGLGSSAHFASVDVRATVRRLCDCAREEKIGREILKMSIDRL